MSPIQVSHSDDTTNHLLNLAHARNADALAKLCTRYWDRLLTLAAKYLTGCPFPVVGADDAVQSALVSFHDRFQRSEFDNLADKSSLWHLLATITRRKVLQAIRREQRLKRGGGKVVSLKLPSPDFDALANDELPGSEPSPAEEAMAKDLLDQLFHKLNDTNRQVVWLRLAGFGYVEIAERLGKTQKSVERRLDTIREELRCLGEVG